MAVKADKQDKGKKNKKGAEAARPPKDTREAKEPKGASAPPTPRADGLPGGVAALLHFADIHHRVQKAEIAELTPFGFSPAQYDVLFHLAHQPGITQQILAERLLVTKGNVCGLIDRLAAQGMVERRADPDDRRANRLHLTEAGQDAARQILPLRQKVYADLTGGLSAKKQAQLQELLAELKTELEARENVTR